MNKHLLGFISGFCCATLLFCAVGFGIFIHGCQKDLEALDKTDVYSDAQVRQAIAKSGINLPQCSWNLFYAISGFQDHAVWITATVPKEDLWNVVEISLHKTRSDFTNGIPNNFFDRVEGGAKQAIDTSLWNPRSVTTPLHFSKKEKGGYYEDWLVDENGGRIFVTKVNT
jgi:hypothetical protein